MREHDLNYGVVCKLLIVHVNEKQIITGIHGLLPVLSFKVGDSDTASITFIH